MRARVQGIVALALAVTAGATMAAEPSRSFPPNARRATPPGGLAERAVAVGAQAPSIRLPASDGSTWSLAAARRSGPVVIVFYRGDW